LSGRITGHYLTNYWQPMFSTDKTFDLKSRPYLIELSRQFNPRKLRPNLI